MEVIPPMMKATVEKVPFHRPGARSIPLSSRVQDALNPSSELSSKKTSTEKKACSGGPTNHKLLSARGQRHDGRVSYLHYAS